MTPAIHLTYLMKWQMLFLGVMNTLPDLQVYDNDNKIEGERKD